MCRLAKNAFLEKQALTNKAFFQEGLRAGRQQILDMMSIVLNDPEIMGKDTFGKDRLVKVVMGIDKYLCHFQNAWERSDEADYYRSKLDDHLVEIYGSELHDSFLKRYPCCPDYDYVKGKWKR